MLRDTTRRDLSRVCEQYGVELRTCAAAEVLTMCLKTKAYINVLKPTLPYCANAEIRLETFETWPIKMPVKQKRLCDAGFYCRVRGDKSMCLYCGGDLNNLEKVTIREWNTFVGSKSLNISFCLKVKVVLKSAIN